MHVLLDKDENLALLCKNGGGICLVCNENFQVYFILIDEISKSGLRSNLYNHMSLPWALAVCDNNSQVLCNV
jgi:hypothetical protein